MSARGCQNPRNGPTFLSRSTRSQPPPRECQRPGFGGGRCANTILIRERWRRARFSTHLLAGSMVCGSCGGTIAQVSGKSGGYCGCLAATKGACENETPVRRTLAEKVILGAIQQQIADPEHIAYVLRRVELEIAKLRSDPRTPSSSTRPSSARSTGWPTSSISSANAAAARRSPRPWWRRSAASTR